MPILLPPAMQSHLAESHCLCCLGARTGSDSKRRLMEVGAGEAKAALLGGAGERYSVSAEGACVSQDTHCLSRRCCVLSIPSFLSTHVGAHLILEGQTPAQLWVL